MCLSRFAISRSILLALCLSLPACVRVKFTGAPPAADATTVVIVRHAEKLTNDPVDPALSPAGEERARALSEVLKAAEVSAIYTTQYKRNIQTAGPTSSARNISITQRPVNTGNSATYAADLAREVLEAQKGKTVLVVGHSNTVPQLVQAFSGITIPALHDNEYDHIFVVVISHGSPARLYNLRFGRPAP